MAKINVTGTLYWETGLSAKQSGRVEGAIIKYKSDSVDKSVMTDDDGDFEIPNIDDSKHLPCVVIHEDGRSSRTQIKSEEFAEPVELRITSIDGRRAQWFGGITLGVFIILLAVLTQNYLDSHRESSEISNKQYSALIEAFKSMPATLEETSGGALAEQQEKVRNVKQLIDNLRAPTNNEVDELVEDIVTYKVAEGAEDINDLSSTIQSAVDKLRNPEGRFFWSAWPWVLVELWSWGLFGVLLTKIVRIGWYLRSSTYHSHGTWMHIAHVVATPFLALVAVLVLSFLKLEGESQTIVDLGNPLFMVIAACLLSTNPWGLWDFVLGQGDALRDRAKSAK